MKKFLFIIKITALMIIPLSMISSGTNQVLISLKENKNQISIPIKNEKSNKASKSDEPIDLINNYDLQIHAKIVPVKSSVISSRIDATVKDIFVKEGEYFRKNQKILEFDCAIIKADADKIQAQMENAKSTYEANLHLYNLNGIDKVSLSKSKSEYNSLAAEYKIKELLMKYCIVKAPFPGQMTDIYVHDYETISRGDNLFKIVDDKDLIVKAFIPSEWISMVHVGDKFTIKIVENNKSYQGKITRLVKNIDSISRTIKIIGKLDKKYADVTPGMSGYITSLKK